MVGSPGGLKATWFGHASFLVEMPIQPGRKRGIPSSVEQDGGAVWDVRLIYDVMRLT
jgi:hypothetical protein